IGIVSRDPESAKVLHSVFGQGGHARISDFGVEGISSGPDKTSQAVEELDFLVLDIDGVGPKEWADALRALNADPHAPRVVVVFDPSRHEKKNVAMLEKLSRSDRFVAYAKPINVLEALQHVQLWAE